MMFWKKKKQLTLRCVTQMEKLADLIPIERLNKQVPDWWKKLPSRPDNTGLVLPPHTKPGPRSLELTAKHCYALQELWSRAVALPLWYDAIVTVTPDGQAVGFAPAGQKAGEQHPTRQYTGALNKNWAHYKFKCPWLLYTEEFVPWTMNHPFYHYNDPGIWQAMPGITEYKYQHHANVNAVFAVKPEATEYEFHAGDIINYLIPMADIDVKVVCEQVTRDEYERLQYSTKLSFHHHKFCKAHDVS